MSRQHQKSLQLTVRGVSPQVAEIFRRRASEGRKSLNQVLVDALTASAGLTEQPVRRRDLSDLAGRWVEDPDFDEALAAQDVVDESMWR